MRALEQMLRLHPESVLTHQAAAEVAIALHQWDRAEASLRECLRLQPGDAEILRRLGDVLALSGRPDPAQEVYLASAGADPHAPDLRSGLAGVNRPALGGLFVLSVILVTTAFTLLFFTVRPVTIWILTMVLFAVGAKLSRVRSVRTTRTLSAEARHALRSEHRNEALGWLHAYGAISWFVALAAFARPNERGGSGSLTMIIVLISLASFAFATKFTVGPVPIDRDFPGLQRWWRRLMRVESARG